METTSSAPAQQRASIYTSPAATGAIIAAFAAAFVGFAVWSGDWYTTWKALHILMAIVWVGGALMIQLFALRILKESDSRRIAEFTRDVEFIGMRTFIPASLILVVLGFVLMHQGHWEWKFWAIFAIVVWALSFVSGAAYLGPESGRIGKLIQERGGVDAEIQSRIERILFHSRIEMALIALLAMDMVLKPGL
jgi:uncharacterized membrane protein